MKISIMKTMKYSWQTGVALAAVVVLAIVVRVVGFGQTPPSLYWEEVALGYDAYSIAETGRDHHGNYLPFLAFESFGDWKPSGYFYALVPFVAAFGLNEWVVRLPSLLAGVGIVILSGWLARLLFTIDEKTDRMLQITATLIASFSPWGIIFSRAAWEVNLATFFVLFAVVVWLLAIKKPALRWWLFGTAAILLALAAYTYHSARVLSPLLFGGLWLYWLMHQQVSIGKKNLLQQLPALIKRSKPAIFAGILLLVALMPFFFSLQSDQVSQRFDQTIIFSDLGVIELSNERREMQNYSLASRLFYHRWWLFGQEVVANFLSHLSLNFLFLTGDNNPRHSVQFYGQLYHLDALFLLIGSYVAVRRHKKASLLIAFWLVVGILPAAITKAAPHALRILPTLPVFVALISLGIWSSLVWLQGSARQVLKKRWLALSLPILFFAGLYLAEFAGFWRFYTRVYPQVYASEWQSGYAQMIIELQEVSGVYPDKTIFVSREYGRPAMYYWFYTQQDPRLVQERAGLEAMDQGEFISYRQLQFVGPSEVQPSGIIVGSPEYVRTALLTQSVDGSNLTTFENREIMDAAGKVVWQIVVLP